MDRSEDAAARAAQKRQTLEAALERGRIQLRLDARRPGVRVPAKFAGEPMLVLNLSWRFPDADMVINERGVAATLRFGGLPFRCLLPWSAIFVVVPNDAEPMLWPADVPHELGGPARDGAEEEPEPVEALRPQLSVVSDRPRPARLRAVEDEPEPPPEPPQAPARERAPWLKLVQ